MIFLHTADVHLVPLSEPDGKRRLAVLAELCGLAAQRDGLVISGDLFHSQAAASDQGLLSGLKDALSKAGPKPVLIIPGNHDRPGGVGPHPLDGRHDLGAHVRLLSKEPYEETSIVGVRFFGIPFQTERSGGELLRALPPEARGAVVLLHGTAADRKTLTMYGYDPEDPEESGDSIFLDADLSDAGAAYYAFGHIHRHESWSLKSGSAAYPGSPDAVTVKEEEPRQVLEVELRPGKAPIINKLALQRSARSLRKTVLAIPGAEGEALKDAREFIAGQRSDVRPVVYIRGLGSGRLLEEGRKDLEAGFKDRDPRPIVKLRADVLGDEELSSPGLLQDFGKAMAEAAKATGADPELTARAALIGWLALRDDEKSLDKLLESIGTGS